MEREDVVHLDGAELAPVWFAADAMGLTSKVPFDRFGPMATALDFKGKCNAGAVVGMVTWCRVAPGRMFDAGRPG